MGFLADLKSSFRDRLLAQAEFANWHFFNLKSESNSNQQSKGSVPFLRFYMERETTLEVKPYKRRNLQATFILELRWKIVSSNINDPSRFLEVDNHIEAVYKAIFPTDESDENYLGIEYIQSFEVETETVEIGGPEAIKHSGLKFKIIFNYVRI